MDLDLIRIECEITAGNPHLLTAVIYDALRSYNVFFKASCCHDLHEVCLSCTVNNDCPYRVVFAQQLSTDPDIIRFHQKPSLPFSLYVSEISKDKSSFAVGLVIMGNMVNYAEMFLAALISMVTSAVGTILAPTKFSLKNYCLDYQAVRHEIKESSPLTESVIMLSGLHIIHSTVNVDSVRLIFTSPIRLLSNGSISHLFDFEHFFRSQLRRCSSLWAYYGSGELDLDFAGLSHAAQYVDVLEDNMHYAVPECSNNRYRRGLIGIVDCSTLVVPMFSLLLLGSYFNSGKGATFGSGHYQIEAL